VNISVCLATYNGAQYIEELLSSIIVQLREGDEILIADDGSTDDTVRLASAFGRVVRVLTRERVGGPVKNFERVLAAANCGGIALCDQDDVWLPGRMDLIRERLKTADLVVLNGRVVNEVLEVREESIFEYVGIRRGFLRNVLKNSFVGCCMAFRSTIRDRALPFPRGVPWHDWYIGLVACVVGRVEYTDERTMLYRRHAGNASNTGEASGNSAWRKLVWRVRVVYAVLVAVLRRAKVATSIR
jgi:glycosyltransferase involved in cell wall biosynthesis